MSRQEYYTYSKTYEYAEEFPHDGAIADGVEEARTLAGDVTWTAEILWNEGTDQYEVDMIWTDNGDNFSEIGEGPKEDNFLEDLSSYLEAQGIDSDEWTY